MRKTSIEFPGFIFSGLPESEMVYDRDSFKCIAFPAICGSVGVSINPNNPVPVDVYLHTLGGTGIMAYGNGADFLSAMGEAAVDLIRQRREALRLVRTLRGLGIGPQTKPEAEAAEGVEA